MIGRTSPLLSLFRRRSAPEILSPEAYAAYIRKNEVWNFVVNLLDLTFFNLAMSFIYSSTVLTVYASHLTDSAVLIGLIPAMQSVGYYLPQLLAAPTAQRLARKKPMVVKFSVMERFPYIFVTLGILLWPDAPRALAFAILAISLTLAFVSGGIGGPAWFAMLAKVIRPERRGLLFGLSTATGGLMGIAGAVLSRHVLSTYAYPMSFGISFLLCFICQLLSWTCLTLNREPAQEPTGEALSLLAYVRKLPQVLRSNANFCRYLGSRVLLILGGMSGTFFILYARRSFVVGDAFAADLTMVSLISQTAITPALGWLADRRGHKWLAELTALVAAAAVGLALLAPSAAWFYAVFMLMSIGASGMGVATMSLNMEFCSHDDVPTYAALSSTLLAPPILLAPIIGGWLVDTVGYQALFVTALVLTVAGLATMRWVVREPRHLRASEEA
ncbi:MAG: MFS transporter [Anaerolineae bacterium]